MAVKQNPQRLVLIDGYGIIFRAYHAVRTNLTNSKGEQTNAIYGFTTMLLDVLQRENPDYVIMALDGSQATFRHEEFSDYKANRSDMPEDLRGQLHRIREIIEALGICNYIQEGYEADDIIGTLAKQATAQNLETFIITGDNDLLQLVNEKTRAVMPGAGPKGRFSDARYYDTAGVVEKYGFGPEFVPDFKALQGDNSDNIPSVPGIGKVTATDLISQFGHAEQILERLDEIKKPKIQEALRSHKEQVLQSKRIATIVLDVPLTLDLEKARVGQGSRAKVIELFRDLEFKSLLDKLNVLKFADGEVTLVATSSPTTTKTSVAQGKPKKNGQLSMFDTDAPDIKVTPAVEPFDPAGATPNVPSGAKYTAVRTLPQLHALVERIKTTGRFGFDTETDSADPVKARLVGLSFAPQAGEAYYVPVNHILQDGKRADEQLDQKTVLELVAPLFQNPQIEKSAHNASFDIAVLHRAGLDLHSYQVNFDTMLAAQLLGKQGGLKHLAFYDLNIEMTKIEELIGTGRKQITFDYVPIEKAAAYASADADMTLRLVDGLAAELVEKNLKDLFENIEMPLIPVITIMELCGVALDVPSLQTISTSLYQKIQELEKEIYEAAGYTFNINSPDQLGQLLAKLDLKGSKKTSTGKVSTSKETLEAMRDKHPIIAQVLDYRHVAKLKSTYVDALPLLINSETKRVHTSFHQIGSATGRVSSSDPNLQNIPIRSDIGGEIRRAFVADSQPYNEDAVLFAADYSQIELRILAHYSQDERLLDAFLHDKDVHAATASDVFGIAPEEVTPNMRRLAKTVNFGIIYGLSAFGLSQRTDFTYQEASSFIKTYNERYPGIRAYLDQTPDKARQTGYVETIFGRRRLMAELKSENAVVRQAAERQAINMPVQGTAADILKKAMIKIYDEMRQKKLKSRMLLQVHDELVFEAPRSELPVLGELVRRNMESVVQLSVPLIADLKIGQNWRDMESYKLTK